LFVKQAIHFGFVPGRDVVVQAIPLRRHGEPVLPLQRARFAGTRTFARRPVTVFAAAQENFFVVSSHLWPLIVLVPHRPREAAGRADADAATTRHAIARQSTTDAFPSCI